MSAPPATSGPRRSSGQQLLLTLASLVVLVAGLKAAAPLLVPFVSALFLSILSLPLLQWLERRMPRGVAVALAVLANLALLVGVGFLVSGSVAGFINAAPRYRAGLEQIYGQTLGWFHARGVPVGEWLAEGRVDPGSILDFLAGTVRRVASLVTNLVLVILVMVFVLLEVSRLPAKLRAALGISAEQLVRYTHASAQVQRYLLIKTLVSMVTGLLIGIGVALIGLDFPLLWGLIAFLFNYIPNLGSILAALPACLLSLVQLGVGPTILVALLYLAVNLFLGNLVEPQLMGRRLGLSPLVVFLSLVFWGWVWGPLGMLLSVPLTVMVRIFLENSPELAWVAVLLAARPMPPRDD